MIFRRKRRSIPTLNTTSTADISFMLLIFFLVTTSMDMDKGLSRQLPPVDKKQKEERTIDVDRDNLLSVSISADNVFSVNDSIVPPETLRRRFIEFVAHCPDREAHIISVNADRAANYDSYFFLQNEIVAAYNTLREARARRTYGHTFSECTQQQQQALREYYPQRIAEDYGTAADDARSQKGGRP